MKKKSTEKWNILKVSAFKTLNTYILNIWVFKLILGIQDFKLRVKKYYQVQFSEFFKMTLNIWGQLRRVLKIGAIISKAVATY